MHLLTERPRSGRGYIIALSGWRSRLALIAALITVSFSLYGITGGMIYYTQIGKTTAELFHWFTINSNFLTGFGAALIIPYAVEGIRRKHFSYPRWIAMLHYSGMVCTTLTMVFSVGIMSWVDPEAAFGGYNRYLHILCPIMVLVSFFLVESGCRYTRRDVLLAAVPSLVYEAVYLYEVVIVGEANGGWEDMYHMAEYVPIGVSVLVITVMALGISALIRLLYNRLARYRARRLEAGLWPPDTDPVEINIELFGLGRYMGKHADTDFIELPLDLIRLIAARYGLKTEALVRPYIRGFLDSQKEKSEK